MKLSELNLYDIGHSIQLVGAVYAGKGEVYLCMFPEEHDHDTKAIVTLEMSDDDWKQFLRQSDVLDVETHSKQADGTLKKAILRKSQRQVDQVISWNVYRRDSYRCRYCGKNDVPLTVDHIICWEAGGPTIEENLLTSCKKCNRTRSDTTYQEWLKSDYYKRVSVKLTAAIKAENEELLAELNSIPRVVHARSR